MLRVLWRKRWIAIIAAFTVVPQSAPAQAQSVASDQADWFVEAGGHLAKGQGKEALSVLDKAKAKGRIAGDAGRYHQLRSVALIQTGKNAAALDAISEANKANPDIDGLAAWTFEFGLMASDLPIAKFGADRLISAFPATGRQVNTEAFFEFLRLLRESDKSGVEADNYLVRFASIGLSELDRRLKSNLLSNAARIMVKRNDIAGADKFAEKIFAKQDLTELLISNESKALWSQIEERVGPGMDKAADSELAMSQAFFDERPALPEARVALMTAMQEKGKTLEAIAIGQEFAPTETEIQKLGQNGAWLIDLHASLLYSAGRNTEADARYASLRALQIEHNPWLISMVINRVEMLVKTGQYEKAMPLLEEAGVLSEKFGSTYARQLIRRLKLCRASKLKQDVTGLLADVRGHANDALLASAEGLLCAGMKDEAAALVIKALNGKDTSSTAVMMLQPPESVWDRDPSAWRNGLNELLLRSDVATAFNASGRVLPKTFWPSPVKQ